MKNFTRVSLPILTLTLAVAGFEPVQAGNARPFRAVGTAVWDNVFAGFGPGATFEGSGYGTHLGNFAQAGTLLFEGGPAPVVPGYGSVVLVAANGDELHFDYVGELDSTTGVGTGTLLFTGGTGRFEDASGSGAFHAEIDLSGGPVNAPMTVWLWGDLQY